MGMSCAELNDINPAQLFLKIEGFNNLERSRAEMMRIHAYLIVSPYIDSKNPISILKFWPFPWDGEKTEKEKQNLKEQAKIAHERWKKVDAAIERKQHQNTNE